MQDMTNRELGRELAFQLDEDGVTAAELRDVMAYMADRIRGGEDTPEMLHNYEVMREAEREMAYWEGTAAEHASDEGAVAPAPSPVSRVFVIDDNRMGVAREQAIPCLSAMAQSVIERDLADQGFARVTEIPDAGVTGGRSTIWFKPARDTYISGSEHRAMFDMLFDIMIGRLQ